MAVFPLACEYVGSSVWTIELWFLDFRFGTQSSLRTKRVTRGVSEGSVGERSQKGPLTGGQCLKPSRLEIRVSLLMCKGSPNHAVLEVNLKCL